MESISRRAFAFGSAGLAAATVIGFPKPAAALPLTAATFQSLVASWAFANSDKILSVAASKGGWEKWAQAEIALYIMLRNRDYDFCREVPVYGDASTADFVLNYAARTNQTYVELKCQSNYGSDNFARFLLRDYAKLQRLRDAQQQAGITNDRPTLLSIGIQIHHGSAPPNWMPAVQNGTAASLNGSSSSSSTSSSSNGWSMGGSSLKGNNSSAFATGNGFGNSSSSPSRFGAAPLNSNAMDLTGGSSSASNNSSSSITSLSNGCRRSAVPHALQTLIVRAKFLSHKERRGISPAPFLRLRIGGSGRRKYPSCPHASGGGIVQRAPLQDNGKVIRLIANHDG
jgi:hypothetical protein